LFLDELNSSSHEVQKAFYSLILERRLGGYRLHPESVVIGAGNRSQDAAIVRPMSSALVNRMVHVHLVSSPRDWLVWARSAGVHPWVVDYIAQRPDHLVSVPPKHEEPFSTPRSWHMLSDLLHSYRAGSVEAKPLPDEVLRVLALSTVSPADAVRRHPLFAPLAARTRWAQTRVDSDCPAAGWAVVTSGGVVHLHPTRRGEPEEWAWVAAHALLHLGFEHLADRHRRGWGAASGAVAGAGFDRPWNVAACLAVNRFLAHLKIGRSPSGLGAVTGLEHLVATTGAESALAETLRERGVPDGLDGCGVGGVGGDLVWTTPFRAPNPYGGYPAMAGHVAVPGGPVFRRGGPPSWGDLLARGLTAAVEAAVDVAGGAAGTITGGRGPRTRWRQALDWFITNYPLLGGLAAAFTIVEDADIARRHDISVAAISPVAAEMYLNPLCGFSPAECRFVIAHELLHAGLRHDTRCGGRDPWLWNIACDYVINDWLVQMEVGDLPDGSLHDRQLRGPSAEQVYDRIAADWRRYRKLATLRGVGLVDVLPGRLPGLAEPTAGVDLDEFYRRALVDGVGFHTARGRGLLPAGLVEEIRALTQPPMPWDVELARWFGGGIVLRSQSAVGERLRTSSLSVVR
jgi:hypothetical protein